MSARVSLSRAIKRYFVAGVLVVVPLILTYLVLKLLFDVVDSLLEPLVMRLFGFWIPGLGLVTTVLLIFLAGVLTRNYLGAALYRIGDRLLVRLPLIRPIYSAAKQLLEALAGPTNQAFKAVVLIEYPRRGCYAMSFLAKRIRLEIGGELRRFAAVFIPSTPTPMSGMVVLLPEDEVMVLDMTVEEGLTFVVSGGVATPELLKQHPLPQA